MAFDFATDNNTLDEVIDNIDAVLDGYETYFYQKYTRNYCYAEGLLTRAGAFISYENLLLIKRIKTKNDALLNFKNEDKLVSYHCKRISEA